MRTLTYSTNYAYPSSPHAKELGREDEGAFYVARTFWVDNNPKPPVIHEGPYKTRASASLATETWRTLYAEATS